MKKIYKMITYPMMGLLAMGMVGCDDFFEPDTDDILDGDSYMVEQTHIYTGFLGIATRLQAVADKAIYLTDTRADLLEPTAYSTSELISIYDYDDDLSGNNYADPAAYYDVIIACNDYLVKLNELHREHPELLVDLEDKNASPYRHYIGLASSTLRIKVWAYLTLAEIYGEALWFDDPIYEIADLTNTDKFQLLKTEQVVNKCLALLEYGFTDEDGTVIDGKQSFSWWNWLDPDNDLNLYRSWDYMVPAYEALYAKLNLWKGAYQQSRGEDATATYESVVRIMQNTLTTRIKENNQYGVRGQMDAPHSKHWNGISPDYRVAVCVVGYDYTKNQTNQLLKHFNETYPNEYLLCPSEVGMNRYYDNTFNPGNSSANYARHTVNFETKNGQRYLKKYLRDDQKEGEYLYQHDMHVYIYRSDEYHFYLIEALNQLERFKEADVLMNIGLSGYKNELGANALPTWEDFLAKTTELGHDFSGYSSVWVQGYEGAHKNYANAGIRASLGLSARAMIDEVEVGDTEAIEAARRFNDEAIADETMLEFAAEGKTYATLVRMAIRYNDPSIIADRVCPKYPAGKQDVIRGKIENGGYWVPWDLQLGDLNPIEDVPAVDNGESSGENE